MAKKKKKLAIEKHYEKRIGKLEKMVKAYRSAYNEQFEKCNALSVENQDLKKEIAMLTEKLEEFSRYSGISKEKMEQLYAAAKKTNAVLDAAAGFGLLFGAENVSLRGE